MYRFLFIACGIAITCAVLFTVDTIFPAQFGESLASTVSRDVNDMFSFTLPTFLAKGVSAFIYVLIIAFGGILGDVTYRGLKKFFTIFSKK